MSHIQTDPPANFCKRCGSNLNAGKWIRELEERIADANHEIFLRGKRIAELEKQLAELRPPRTVEQAIEAAARWYDDHSLPEIAEALREGRDTI